MKNYLPLLLLILFCPIDKALCQLDRGAENADRCCSVETREYKLLRDKTYDKYRLRLHNEINEYLVRKDLIGEVIVIPVVFHVFHTADDPVGSSENIPEDLIYAQLQQINDDFRRQNADTTDTPNAFKNLAVDTEIEFCLTELDPEGNETTGIIRHNIDQMPDVREEDCWTTSYIDQNIVRPTIWDRDKYLNIYSLIGIDAFLNGTCQRFANLGYAQFPGGDPTTDAVVLSFFSIGSLDMPNPLINIFKGRTATHEIAHWLDLEHPWGVLNGGCREDDGYLDTPLQDSPLFNCPTFPVYDNCTTGGDGIMFMNFMNYVDDDCMNLFTSNQKDWMRALVVNGRASLITATCSNTFLAIEDVSDLKATVIGDDIEVEWNQTISPHTDEVIVEHTQVVPDFEEIGRKTIDHSLSVQYNRITHENPQNGTHYYRLKLKNEVGEWDYSKIVSASIQIINENIIVHNPVKDILSLKKPDNVDFLKYEIYDVEGKLVYNNSLTEARQDILVSDYESGMYLIHFRSPLINKTVKWIKI